MFLSLNFILEREINRLGRGRNRNIEKGWEKDRKKTEKYREKATNREK